MFKILGLDLIDGEIIYIERPKTAIEMVIVTKIEEPKRRGVQKGSKRGPYGKPLLERKKALEKERKKKRQNRDRVRQHRKRKKDDLLKKRLLCNAF